MSDKNRQPYLDNHNITRLLYIWASVFYIYISSIIIFFIISSLQGAGSATILVIGIGYPFYSAFFLVISALILLETRWYLSKLERENSELVEQARDFKKLVNINTGLSLVSLSFISFPLLILKLRKFRKDALSSQVQEEVNLD